jgi:hypothetical protein
MKNILYVLSGIIILFCFSCKKEPKTVYVTYKVMEISNNTPSYTVGYTLADKSTKTLGSFTQSKWVSDKIEEVDKGTYISLSVEGSGGGSYDMFIYINGVLHSRRQADDGHGKQILEAQIPY